MKQKIWIWFVRNIFKIPEGRLYPKWVKFLSWIVFPIRAIRWWPYADPRYEPVNDTLVYYGRRYSGDVFRSLSEKGIKEGTKFMLVKRETDGTIILKELGE